MDIIRKSKTRIKRIKDSHLVIIDDLMYAVMDPRKTNLISQLVNNLYNISSIILTSNRLTKEWWTNFQGDIGVATAILDRLIHRAEIIHFNDSSYRMKHRKTIFKEEVFKINTLNCSNA